MDFFGWSGRWTATVIAVRIVLLGLAPTYECQPDLQLSASLNIFERFGHLWISMRVVHQYNPVGLFDEPTRDLFPPLPTPPPAVSLGHEGFEGDFKMKFCDDASQLLDAYFRRFTIERVERPRIAFTASWPKTICADRLGIDPTFFGDTYSFILVRLSRPRRTARLTPVQSQQLRLPEKYKNEIIPGNMSSLQAFFKKFGTHYINSYSTGDALYQVTAYRKSVYKRIKNRFDAEGVTSITPAELVNYFSPSFADHIGKIHSASSNQSVEDWAAEQLKLSFPFLPLSYPCLIKICTNPALLQALDSLLGDEAMLQLELRSLELTLTDERQRRWFGEILDNRLALWGANQFQGCYKKTEKKYYYP